MKERVREIAAELIRIAAARELKSLPPIDPPQGLYDEFCARFPYQETEDQERPSPTPSRISPRAGRWTASSAAMSASARPRWRCAPPSSMAMSGQQVAVVVPTTLAGAPAFPQFRRALRGLPAEGAPALALRRCEGGARDEGRRSRRRRRHRHRHACAAGQEHRVQAISASSSSTRSSISASTHKERLKALKADVHVLTLTATPIPRTLQLALSGVRDLSLITTPPVDRLAVRTFVTPFDPLVDARGAAARALSRRAELLCLRRASPICARPRNS